nr:thymosin beta 1 [Doryrhamphus excisus]
MGDNNPVTDEVVSFDKCKLKKTITSEKNKLPTTADIEAEKKVIQEECSK